jgi:hypothetical protein
MATVKAVRRAKFEAVFSKIRDELIEHFAGEGMPQEAVEWYRNVRACSSLYSWLYCFKKMLEPQLQCSWR